MPVNPLSKILEDTAKKAVILDGGFGTELERIGKDYQNVRPYLTPTNSSKNRSLHVRLIYCPALHCSSMASTSKRWTLYEACSAVQQIIERKIETVLEVFPKCKSSP